jgi:riboflavin kinase / FMN adenylyltransferase
VNQSGSIVTVGSFDGVHRGHRAVLDEIARRARAGGRQSVLVTFTPHPLEIVNPAAAPPLLTAGDERLEVLAETEIDRVLVLRFDRQTAAMTPREFVLNVLLDRCGMRELVIGYDHGFGRGRSGDADTLRALGAELGFAVDVVAPVDAGGQQVSSSRIRRAIAGGDLMLAARLLGRPYTVHGRVEAGAGRGRQLGVPTINLGGIPPQKLLPPDGVYAVRVEWRGGSAGGMMNQGGRPTFDESRRTLEAHLFGVDQALYGEHVRLAWIGRIRDVRRFGSAGELQEQLVRDRSAAETILGTHT